MFVVLTGFRTIVPSGTVVSMVSTGRETVWGAGCGICLPSLGCFVFGEVLDGVLTARLAGIARLGLRICSMGWAS